MSRLLFIAGVVGVFLFLAPFLKFVADDAFGSGWKARAPSLIAMLVFPFILFHMHGFRKKAQPFLSPRENFILSMLYYQTLLSLLPMLLSALGIVKDKNPPYVGFLMSVTSTYFFFSFYAYLRLFVIRKSVFKFKKTVYVQDLQEPEEDLVEPEEYEIEPPKPKDFVSFAKSRIVGQDKAIELLSKAINVGLKLAERGDERRKKVLATLLFVGPTGVGKTELAKTVGDFLRTYGYSFHRIDMNQFADENAVWTLLGSLKGYVGSDKPGLLPSYVAQNPRVVLLFDEIEKANQGLYEPLLQLFDEGYVIERSTGQKFFTNSAILIITSNLANREIGEIASTVADEVEQDLKIREVLENTIRGYTERRAFRFTPEFLGRIDQIVPFRNLTDADLLELTRRELQKLGAKQELAQSLFNELKPVADKYGVRYYLKKVRERVLVG